MQVIWKDIKGYEGRYMVSNHGEILSTKFNGKGKSRILKQNDKGRGYLSVSLYKDKKVKPRTVHRIVAETFIPNPNNLPQINHIDGNKKNNNINNLEWCTAKENVQHAWKNGLVKMTEERRKRSIKHLEKYKKISSVEINQYTLDEKYVKTWSSIKEASETLKISAGNICNCCKGKLNQTGGYKWAYEWK